MAGAACPAGREPHAAPTELELVLVHPGYSHGAPNGAGRKEFHSRPSFSDCANAEQQRQVKVLNAELRQGNPYRIPVLSAGQDGDLHGVISH